MSNSEDLKPCPFCGGEAVAYRFGTGYMVKCLECAISTLCENTKSEAIEAWNKRANSEKPNLTYADIEKMVNLHTWEVGHSRGGWEWQTAMLGELMICREYGRGKHKGKVFLSADVMRRVFPSDIKAYAEAQRLVVDIVADALGVERSGK